MSHYSDNVVLDLSIDEVRQKTQLEYIGFSDDGYFELSYNDGGIFGGHLMTGYFDYLGQLTSSDIVG